MGWFLILWTTIFFAIIFIIIKYGREKGKYRATPHELDRKTSLDEDMFTDPSWRGSSFNMFH